MALLAVSSSVAEEPRNTGEKPKWIISSGAVVPLPPGSLVSLAVTLEKKIEAIKLDLVLSGDDQVMVLPDPRINAETNVAQHFSDRSREDGSYYSVDFSRAELKELAHRTNDTAATFPGTPVGFTPEFPVIALDEALGYIDLVHAELAQRPVVICELRKGWEHRREGKDLAGAVYALLQDYLRRSGRAELYLASYDPDELQRLSAIRDPGDTAIKFIQLIGSNDGAEVKTFEFGQYQPFNYDLLFTKFGLKAVSTYAAAIGLQPQTILYPSGTVTRPQYLDDAHTLGMEVILYGEVSGLQFDAAAPTRPTTILEHLFDGVGFDAVVSDDAELIEGWQQGRSEPNRTGDQQSAIERLIEQIERGSSKQPASDRSGTTR
jgi:glycerophosphoryl diester phosphodiesterase